MAVKKRNRAAAQEAFRERSLPFREQEEEEENMKPLSFRISDTHREKLRRYFKRKGLRLTQGIRMVLAEYIEAKDL